MEVEAHQNVMVGGDPCRFDALSDGCGEMFFRLLDDRGVQRPGGDDVSEPVVGDPVGAGGFCLQFDHHLRIAAGQNPQRGKRAVVIPPGQRVAGLPGADVPHFFGKPDVGKPLGQVVHEPHFALLVE